MLFWCSFGAAKTGSLSVSQTHKVKEIRLIIGIVKCETKGKKCNTESEVISMLEFHIDNIFVEFRGEDFQKIMGMLKGIASIVAEHYTGKIL